MKKVFIYVGHSNWGKSRALKVITKNNSFQKIIQIAQHTVRVRKMSNDDDEKGLLDWVKTFPQLTYQRFIIAFCPNILHQNILKELQKASTLYFFVQEEKFNSPQEVITPQEINWLRTWGTVHVLSGQNPDTIRASEFHEFVSLYI